jgi:phosphatidylglycerophosphatase C
LRTRRVRIDAVVSGARRQLAVFDLDGTITRRDTLFPYVLGFLKRRPWRLPGLLLILPTLVLFALRLADHGKLKASLIKATLRGCTRAEIDSWTARFVPKLIERGLFADALNRIAAHGERGDLLVLMSASTDLYVPAVARELGFDDVICTGVRWNGDRLHGELTTPNRRGPEKARCFRALRQSHPDLPAAAYGNTRSDLDHLQLAEQPLLVNGSPRARREAARLGVPCVHWR